MHICSLGVGSNVLFWVLTHKTNIRRVMNPMSEGMHELFVFDRSLTYLPCSAKAALSECVLLNSHPLEPCSTSRHRIAQHGIALHTFEQAEQGCCSAFASFVSLSAPSASFLKLPDLQMVFDANFHHTSLVFAERTAEKLKGTAEHGWSNSSRLSSIP